MDTTPFTTTEFAKTTRPSPPGGHAGGDQPTEAGHPGARSPRRRSKLIGGVLLTLLPLTAAAALLVLHLMGAVAAGATGGCGGG